MLHTKYQDSEHCSFEEEYSKILLLKICLSPCNLDMQRTKSILTIIV